MTLKTKEHQDQRGFLKNNKNVFIYIINYVCNSDHSDCCFTNAPFWKIFEKCNSFVFSFICLNVNRYNPCQHAVVTPHTQLQVECCVNTKVEYIRTQSENRSNSHAIAKPFDINKQDTYRRITKIEILTFLLFEKCNLLSLMLYSIRRLVTVSNDPLQDFEELAVKCHSSVCWSHIAKLKSETGSFSILLREFVAWGMIILFSLVMWGN